MRRIAAGSPQDLLKDLCEIMQGYVADFTGASKTSKSPPQDLQDLHARTSERISPGSPQDLLISGLCARSLKDPLRKVCKIFTRSSDKHLYRSCKDLRQHVIRICTASSSSHKDLDETLAKIHETLAGAS